MTHVKIDTYWECKKIIMLKIQHNHLIVEQSVHPRRRVFSNCSIVGTRGFPVVPETGRVSQIELV